MCHGTEISTRGILAPKGGADWAYSTRNSGKEREGEGEEGKRGGKGEREKRERRERERERKERKERREEREVKGRKRWLSVLSAAVVYDVVLVVPDSAIVVGYVRTCMFRMIRTHYAMSCIADPRSNPLFSADVERCTRRYTHGTTSSTILFLGVDYC